jgi:hypothetical protein
MSESRTIQDVVMQSIQAEDAGCIINWKETCLQIVQAAQAEFARMTAESEPEVED